MPSSLVEDMKQIHNRLVRDEVRLAQLHANIYKRREEARNIRTSLPVQDGAGMTEDRLRQKQNKALSSIHRLHENTQRNIEKYVSQTTPAQPLSYVHWFVLLIVLMAIVFVISLAWKRCS